MNSEVRIKKNLDRMRSQADGAKEHGHTISLLDEILLTNFAYACFYVVSRFGSDRSVTGPDRTKT